MKNIPGNNNQKGVSLIIIFFIMTIVIAMVLSISTILSNEIRIIGDVGNSASSSYVSDDGIEKTLYYHKQIPLGGTGSGICNIVNTCTDCNNVTLTGNDCGILTCTDCQLSYDSSDANKKNTVSATVKPNYLTPSVIDIDIVSTGDYKNLTREAKLSSTGDINPGANCMAAHWKFDEDPTIDGPGTVADSSGNNNNGTPVGSAGANNLPQPSTDVPSGMALSDPRSLNFDGTDDVVQVPNSSSLNITTNAMTVYLWVKGGAQGNYKYLVGKSDNGGTLGYSLYTGPTGTLRSFFGINGALQISQDFGFTWDNAWHQIAAVYNNGAILMYVDGVEQNSTSVEAGNIGDSGFIDLTISGYPGGPGFNFSGLIDDMHICDRALSSSEIGLIYSAVSP